MSLPPSSPPPRLVLYVEDLAADVAFMEDFLSGFDAVRLITAATAEAGVQRARAEAPDVILMDIDFDGGMDGHAALVLLQGSPETRGIPVIALTAHATPSDRARLARAGFLRCLHKPVRLPELEAALALAIPLIAAR